VTAHYRGDHYSLDLPNGSMRASAVRLPPDRMRVDLDGVRSTVTVVRDADRLTVISGGRNHLLVLHDPLTEGMQDQVPDNHLTAPMPGSVIAVMVEPGQSVVTGDALMLLEAMKMEHTISAPYDGVVREVRYRAGDQVEEGAELIDLEQDDA
jgi:3-methylcrotonyl-CoA carboxylase alpha subunit